MSRFGSKKKKKKQSKDVMPFQKWNTVRNNKLVVELLILIYKQAI